MLCFSHGNLAMITILVMFPNTLSMNATMYNTVTADAELLMLMEVVVPGPEFTSMKAVVLVPLSKLSVNIIHLLDFTEHAVE